MHGCLMRGLDDLMVSGAGAEFAHPDGVQVSRQKRLARFSETEMCSFGARSVTISS
jgi:hypothetical protein